MGWWGTRAECGCCGQGAEGGGTCFACSTDHSPQEIQVVITNVVEDSCTSSYLNEGSCTNINGTYVLESDGQYTCRWRYFQAAKLRHKPGAFCLDAYADLWVETSTNKDLTIKTQTNIPPSGTSEWLEWRTTDFNGLGTFGSLPCCAIENFSVPFSTRYWTYTIGPPPTDFSCNASGNSLFSVQRCQPGGSTTCNYGPWQVSSTELSGISGDHSWTSSSNIRVKDSNYATTSADITGPSTETSEYLQSFHDFGSTQNTERIAVQIWGSKPIGTNLRLSDVRIHTSSGALGTQVDGFSPVDLSTTDSLHYFEYTLASATSRSNWWCQIQCDNPSGVNGKPSINYVALQRCT